MVYLKKKMRLKDDIDIFKKSTKPQKSVKKEKKHYFLEIKLYFLLNGKKSLMVLKVE